MIRAGYPGVQKGESRTRWMSIRVLAVTLLLFLSACSGEGEEEIALPGLGADEMATSEATHARRVLKGFLEDLEQSRYQSAAEVFSGDLKFLRDRNQDVSPDDVAELLERLCTRHGAACLPARFVDERKRGRGRYLFEIEFVRGDGSLFATGDTLVAGAAISRFNLRVERIGTGFFVRDLPPH